MKSENTYFDLAVSLFKEEEYSLTEEDLYRLKNLVGEAANEAEVRARVAAVIKNAEKRHMESLFFVVMSGEYERYTLFDLDISDFTID